MTKYILAKDKCKRAINTRGNLMFSWRNYHPKQSLKFSFLLFVCLLLHFVSSFPFLIYKQVVHKEVFPFVAWNIVNCSQSSKQWVFTVVERARSKLISESSESKLNSDSSDEKEMILRQNLDVLVPKYIGTISLVFHFLEQIQRVDWGAIVLGSWVDVIRYRRPRLPKTRSWNTSSATFKGHRKSRIQPNSNISSPKCFKSSLHSF